MPTYTDNHELQLWGQNEAPWEHRADFEKLDTRVPIADTDANRVNYTPKANAWFYATDTKAVYIGDGAAWNAVTFKPTADHMADATNPHGVTAAQVDAPTTAEFTGHTSDTTNPHAVTAAQVDAPTTAEFTGHTSDTSNPHSVTPNQLEYPPRGAPAATDLADGNRTIYTSDGTDGHAAGDLVSARNNAGTIVSQVIAPAANDA